MELQVKLEVFEGPLDLLLHLIEKNKVDIYDIPIVTITQQYLDYMKQMNTTDMDLMSEFLVMAATLVRIKSKMLLPVEETEEEEPEDPRQELVERLLEYKMYKYASFELKDRQYDAGRSFYKPPTVPDAIQNYKEDIDLDDLLSNLTLSKLQSVFDSVMQKQVDKIDPIRSKFGKIEKDEVNIEDQMILVEEYAMRHKHFSFRSLLEHSAGHGKSYIIVSFMSVLELMKTGILSISQKELFGDIEIEYKPQNKEESDHEH